MKQDEYNMILGLPQEIPAKRKNYILKKWEKKGWYRKGPLIDEYTNEFRRIKELVVNKEKYIDELEGKVAIIHFIEEKWGGISQTVGILEDHNDNGWYLHTTNTCRNRTGYFVGDYKHDEIAYVEFHPKPSKIWNRLNYLFWKYCKTSDRFHKKIGEFGGGTVCDYSRASEGIYTYSNPKGKIGECFPCCGCKWTKER